MGCYVHGLFDSPAVLQRILDNVASRHGLPSPSVPPFSMDAEFDRLAACVREALDMDFIYSLIGRAPDASPLAAGGVT